MKQLSQKDIIKLNNSFQNGQKSLAINNYKAAEKYFLDVLKIKPDIFEALNALAYVYVATKQHIKATKQLRIILKNHPNNAKVHQNLANSLYEQKLYDEAIYHYSLAIKNDSRLVDSYINCGITYRMKKDYETAINYLHQALNLDKVNARAFHVLGMLYVDVNDYPRALECLENASGLMPNNAEYRVSFATVLEKAGLDYEAGIEYHKACDINPNYLDSFILYGTYLKKHHQYDEALESFTRAHFIDSNDLDVIDELGYTYLGMSDIENALLKFNEALLKEPNRVASLTGLELTMVDTGKLNKAAELCEQIISLEPDNISGYLLKSRVKKASPSDALIGNLLEFDKREGLDLESRIILNFALGKLYDDLNDYSNAFKYYARGNTLKNSELSYSKEADEAKISEIISFFNDEFFSKNQHLRCDSDLPVFIVGMPRSATTLTEQIISSHPKVIGAGEVPFWNKIQATLPLRLGTEISYPECLKQIKAKQALDIANMYESTLRKIAGISTNPAHITDKMPHNFMAIGLIASLFPKAKIIHTKRNPIDTCLSIYFQNFNAFHQYAFDLESIGFHYKQYERLMQHWHKVLPGKIMDIHYADTISDPEYWSRKLIDHIGLEWDDACLAPHKLERSVKTASHWQVRQPIYKTSVERWKHYESFLHPLIKELNTPLS